MDINPITLPLSLNQNQIDLALDTELAKRRQAKGAYTYTNGRPPKGLFATQTINEETIRQAVINYAKSIVQAQFQHFSVEFVTTRGDDGGLTANIIVSTHEIVPEEGPKEEPAPTPRRVALRTTTATKPTPIELEVSPAKTEPEKTETVEPEGKTEEAGDAPADAPWEGDDQATETVEAEEVDEVVEEAEEVAAAAPEAVEEDAPREPRARLFANLRKPTNEPTE